MGLELSVIVLWVFSSILCVRCANVVNKFKHACRLQLFQILSLRVLLKFLPGNTWWQLLQGSKNFKEIQFFRLILIKNCLISIFFRPVLPSYSQYYPEKFCSELPDGFYKHPRNHSRVLQVLSILWKLNNCILFSVFLINFLSIRLAYMVWFLTRLVEFAVILTLLQKMFLV